MKGITSFDDTSSKQKNVELYFRSTYFRTNISVSTMVIAYNLIVQLYQLQKITYCQK